MSPLAPKRIRVLVVDDSAVVRQVVAAVLSQEEDFIVEVAADPLIAMTKMKRNRPDVILLDLLMPRMHGRTFLRKIMAEDPIAVVICSGVAEKGTEEALRALEEGAVEVVSKPKMGVREFLHDSAVTLMDTIRGAAAANVRRKTRLHPVTPCLSADAVLPKPSKHLRSSVTDQVIVIGASTGGTDALSEVLEAMPADCPGIIIVQHMPEAFTRAFAQRLDQLCQITVKEARNNDPVVRGQALIAPGNFHTMLRRGGNRYFVEVKTGPLVSRHRPSVDVLFRSAARSAGPNAVGIIMTGMGHDGAEGLLEMRQSGSYTIAQDENSCVIFGMPKEAINKGAVQEVVPLSAITPTALRRIGMRAETTGLRSADGRESLCALSKDS